MRSSRRRAALVFHLSGDLVAELIFYALLAGGFASFGYATESGERGLAWMGCAALGAWALIGLSTGRWEGDRMRTSRRLMLAMLVPLAWSAVQLAPLPRETVARASAVRAEIDASYGEAELTLPETATLAHAPARGRRAFDQGLASILFLAAALQLAARRTTSLRLVAALATIGLVEGWLGFVNMLREGGRASGAAFNPSHHAALVAATLPLFFARLAEARSRSERLRKLPIASGANPLLFFGGLGLLAAIGWVGSLSRGSLLFGGLGGAVWLGWEFVLLVRRRSSRRRAQSLAALGSAVGLVALFAFGFYMVATASSFFEGIARRTAEQGLRDAGRTAHMLAAIRGAEDAPLLGLGPAGARRAMNRHYEVPLEYEAIWVHNDWLQLAVELGIPAALLFAAALAWTARSAAGDMRRRADAFPASHGRLQRGALAGAAIALAHASTDFHLRVPLVGFCFLAVLALGLRPQLFAGTLRHRY